MDIQPKQNRRRFTPEERQEVLERYHQSQLRQHEFASREGISLASLSKWLGAERGAARAKARVGRVKFDEIVLPNGAPGWALEIISPQKWTLRLGQAPAASALAELLAAL